MNKWPTLFKLTSTNAIQQWTIRVEGRDIVTEFGQVDGKMQVTQDTIKSGKNLGRSNETTEQEQACAEAHAKWEKQKKKGYVERISDAERGKVDELIQGGISPMLAFPFNKQGHKIKYPAYIQKKYDGCRMIAMLRDGKCTLWSRTRKPITSLPHIIKEIENRFKKDVILDGEAYNDKFKDNFEELIHLVRQEEPDPNHTEVQYHVYDIVTQDPFDKRLTNLRQLLGQFKSKYLVLADTYKVESEEEVPEFYAQFRSEGLEGAILRNADGLYVNKRSYDLIKVKEMQDEEFRIIGCEEGRGKLMGHVGAFFCHTKDGKEFKAKMAGSIDRLKEYFDNPNLWKNKVLTVQFQDYTSYGIPRFPVGKAIRDYE